MSVRSVAARARRVSVLLSVACAMSMFAPFAAHAVGPKISGTPPATILVNYYYRFDPITTDPDTEKKRLRFSIQNKPAWLVFNIYSGRLEGKG
jgi:hypothetical protein